MTRRRPIVIEYNRDASATLVIVTLSLFCATALVLLMLFVDCG